MDETKQPNGMMRVEDTNGHLICKYDSSNQSIYIKLPVGRSSDNGQVFRIDTNILRNLGYRNILSNEPSPIFTAELVDE